MSYYGQTAFMGIAEIDQAETVSLAILSSKVPEVVAGGIRLFGMHLTDFCHSFASAT